MFIVIFSLIAYAVKINRKNLIKYIWGGSFLGIIVSVFTGLFVFGQAQKLEGFAQQLFQGSIMLFLAVLILYNVIGIGKQKKLLSINDSVGEANYNGKAVSLFLIPFLAVFRESLEVIMFVLALISETPINIIIGIIIGGIASFCIMYLIYRTTAKLSIKVIFDILTLVLIFMGATMFGEGIAELMPQLGQSIEVAGKMIYGIPLIYLFLKNAIKAYIKK